MNTRVLGCKVKICYFLSAFELQMQVFSYIALLRVELIKLIFPRRRNRQNFQLVQAPTPRLLVNSSTPDWYEVSCAKKRKAIKPGSGTRAHTRTRRRMRARPTASRLQKTLAFGNICPFSPDRFLPNSFPQSSHRTALFHASRRAQKKNSIARILVQVRARNTTSTSNNGATRALTFCRDEMIL